MSAPPLPLNAWLRWDVVSRLLPRPLGSVLEIGCGQGAVGARLAAAARSYVGVEPDSTSRATAATRLPRVLESLGETAGVVFGLVCAFEVLEHVEDDAAVLREWASRVEPGGWLMLSVPAFAERYGPFDELVGHYRRYDPPALAALLRDAGLTDVTVVAYGGPLGYALEAARNAVGRRRLAKVKAASYADRTSGSGRLLQPPDALGVVTAAAAAPFRLLQRPMTRHGTGLVARARRPA